MSEITPRDASRNSTAQKIFSPTDEAAAYAVRRVAEKFALELPTAMTIARLAGLGEGEARP